MCLHNCTMFYGRTDGYLLCYEFGEIICGICLSTFSCENHFLHKMLIMIWAEISEKSLPKMFSELGTTL